MIIHFNEGDVKVEQHYAREWTAHEVEVGLDLIESLRDGQLIGYGSTMMEAIADLNEKLKERE